MNYNPKKNEFSAHFNGNSFYDLPYRGSKFNPDHIANIPNLYAELIQVDDKPIL